MAALGAFAQESGAKDSVWQKEALANLNFSNTVRLCG